MRKSRVLILAVQHDAHIPYVTDHLDPDEYVIVDTSQMLFGDTLTYWSDGSHNEVVYNGEPLGPIKSVWHRDLSYERMGEWKAFIEVVRAKGDTPEALLGFQQIFHELIGDTDGPYWPGMLPVDALMREYARSGLNRLATALGYMYPDAFWVSRREAIVRAGHKPLQLMLARQCGFRVAETLTTQDAKAAAAFLERHGTCVMKPLSVSAPAGRTQFTKVLRAETPPDFSGLFLSPQIFQELVTPVKELRVTGMGDRTFAAEVSDSDAAREESVDIRDWRASFTKGTMVAKAIELDPEVERQHVALLRRLGVVNGMSDFIVAENGDLVYLETNPNGAFLFIEEATGYPLGATLANMLRNANGENGRPKK